MFNLALATRAIKSKPLGDLMSYLGLPAALVELAPLMNAHALSKSLSLKEPYRLKCQSQVDDLRYYEQIIFEDNQIPTRPDSWHDFFNTIIWHLFPITKAYLNQQHVAQIERFGLHPRTRLRNQITLFDECGVVIATQDKSFKSALAEHAWHEVFVQKKQTWFNDTFPFIFGHANYEMLVQPFIGLTAKALVIEVDDISCLGFGSSYYRDSVLAKVDVKTEQANIGHRSPHATNAVHSRILDRLLFDYLTQKDILNQKKPFKPLPILGIPTWHMGAQDTAFYNNTQYFMPKRK